MTDLGLLSTTEQIELIRKREVTSQELTAHYIDRIERLDHEINAVVTRDFERALSESELAD